MPSTQESSAGRQCDPGRFDVLKIDLDAQTRNMCLLYLRRSSIWPDGMMAELVGKDDAFPVLRA